MNGGCSKGRGNGTDRNDGRTAGAGDVSHKSLCERKCGVS